MYIVIDTEGSGLFNFREPADADGQPRLAQLAMIFCDENWNIDMEFSGFVRPDGWSMEPGATEINGLTDEFLEISGRPVGEILDIYEKAILEGNIVVAFNAQHDCKAMRAEFRRAGRPDLFDQTRNICVMRGSMGIVPKLSGTGGFPKLSDCVAYFGIEPRPAHKALNDAHAAREIAVSLAAIDRLPAPAVHFAKKKKGASSDV